MATKGEGDLTADILVRFLKKERYAFNREDIVKFVKAREIRTLNLNYIGGDGRLKTLSFAIRSERHMRELLDSGERVDGSSLFRYIDTANSDLYIIPRFSTAFLNPFTPEPTLNILCAYFDSAGRPMEVAPEHTVRRAHEEFKKKTRLELYTLGELEYYAFLPPGSSTLYPPTPQRNYHESTPFVKCKHMNEEALRVLATMGVRSKYGHAEVGAIPAADGASIEQFEIEFELEPIEETADHIVLGKWVLRNVAAKHGVTVTFSPKLGIGHAGSGMHIHISAMKNGKSMMADDHDELNDTAKKIIGGLTRLAPSLTAFGNTIPVSYLRLVPHQEAPTCICWGGQNRSVLVRVPLGWRHLGNLSAEVNPTAKDSDRPRKRYQTVEIRSPDGSANSHLLCAGIGVAARHGLTHPAALEWAKETAVTVNIFKEENRHIRDKLRQLPASCDESADQLLEQGPIYEENGVFSHRLIEGVAGQLKAFKDRTLCDELRKDKAAAEAYAKDFIHTG